MTELASAAFRALGAGPTVRELALVAKALHASGDEATLALFDEPEHYGDGYRRGLTNNAEVVVDGRRVPLVGAVSMDNITVDLGPGDRPPVARGAPVTLIGGGVGAEELAGRLATINYEVTCGISQRVPRAYPGERLP